jgi:hypothetical protein
MNQYNTQAQLLGAGLQTGGTLGGAYMNKPASGKRPTSNSFLDSLQYPSTT